MNFRKAIGISAYLLLFFVAGYWVGKTPEFYSETMTIGRAVPRLYVENPDLLNPYLQERLKKLSHIDFEITDIDPLTSDLWITDQNYISLDRKMGLIFHKLENKYVSPDFKTSQLKPFSSLPLGWRFENEKIKIASLSAPIQKKSKQTRSVQMLIQSLLSDEFQLEMIRQSNWNTTLLTLDESNIPPERKASYIRSQSLKRK